MSSATHRPPERMSGRASLASSRISAAVSSTSSNTADQRTSASWLAPTAVSFDSANTRSDGVALRGDSAGTRTSKPASAEAGAGGDHQLPRLVLAQDGVAAAVGARRAAARGACARGGRARASRSARFEPVVDDGALDGDEHLALRAAARLGDEHREVPRAAVRSGGSRRTISAACSRVTARAHPSARGTSSPATRTGASNALPSSRARNASVTSLPVRTTGGAAGTSMRRALSRQMASTMPVSAERVTARASTLGSSAATLPGMASTTSARRSAIDERGRPPHRVRRVLAAAVEPVAPTALPQQRDHRTPGRQLDGPHRDLAQPAHARADVVAHARRSPRRRASRAPRRPAPRPRRPCRRRGRARRGATSTARRVPRRRRGTWRRRRRRRWGSRDRPPRPPPGPAPTRAGGARRRVRPPPARRSAASRSRHRPRTPRRARATLAGEPQERGGELAVEVLGVGDDLVALLTLQATGGDEVLVGVDEQAQEGGAPRRAVGFEDGDLLGRRDVVGLELDVEIEGRVVDARRRDLGRGRAVDRGHRQLAILEGTTVCPRRFGAEYALAPAARLAEAAAPTSVLSRGPSQTHPGAHGGGTAGRRSHG